jgi:hypothetical protein
LTARLVVGNPIIALPEDAVANCYPGLELDVRNFDRRFFPGLVFEFIARNDVSSAYREPMLYGAKLLYVDTEQDPDLAKDQALYDDLTGEKGSMLSDGTWYLDWIEQKGTCLRMKRLDQDEDLPLDGLVVWRLIRSLEQGELRIGLKERVLPRKDSLNQKNASVAEQAAPRKVCLRGRRRAYTDPITGVISNVYQPGELLQSLCSPWQHDFRDCYCHYWASNHPDVVYGEVHYGESTMPGGIQNDPDRAHLLLDWLRRSRAIEAEASNTFSENRPYQVDHFEINSAWQDLPIVIAGTETNGHYVPLGLETADPFTSREELVDNLRKLAALELTLVCEYLYALFSVLHEEQAEDLKLFELARRVQFSRYTLFLIAASEMQHLRWANELLWAVCSETKKSPILNSDNNDETIAYTPVLEPAMKVPTKNGERDRKLRRLTMDVLQDFIDVEHPSGTIYGAYARVIVTLRQPQYERHLVEIALRIANDGMQHERDFMDIKAALKPYADMDRLPYLRQVDQARPDQAQDALRYLGKIMHNLSEAYRDEAHGDLPRTGRYIREARDAMHALFEEGEKLARKEKLGIPFWNQWRNQIT